MTSNTARNVEANDPAVDQKPIEDVDHHELKHHEDGAQHATVQEKNMSLLQAVKLYPKAIGWSMVLSTALVSKSSPRPRLSV